MNKVYVYSRLSDRFGRDMMHPFGEFSNREDAVKEIMYGKGSTMLTLYMNKYESREHSKPDYISYFQTDRTNNPISLCFLLASRKFSKEELVTKRHFGCIGWSED